MFRAALFESGYRSAMFDDARRGRLNPKSPFENSTHLQRGSLNGSGGLKRRFMAQPIRWMEAARDRLTQTLLRNYFSPFLSRPVILSLQVSMRFSFLMNFPPLL
jgi:hypothetical protein